MAQTWSSTPLLKKINIGEVTYFVKDADARAILDTYTTLPTYSATTDITTAGNAVPTAATVKSYVDTQVAAIPNFHAVVYETLPAASIDTLYILGLVAATGSTGSYVEYVTVRQGENPYTYVWEQIGSTQIDLSGYVQKTTTIAGVDLQDNISTAELQTALGLGALAYKASATGTVSTADSGKFTYTPAGTIGGLTFTSTTVSGSSNYTPAGNVSVVLEDATFKAVATVGSQASFDEGTFTPASITKTDKTFATSGVTATIGTEDEAETLILTASGTDTASVITAFSGGAKEADTFTTNALPTTSDVTVGVASASFTGTAATITTSVTYDKTNGATFTGTEAVDQTVTLTKTDKTVSVS